MYQYNPHNHSLIARAIAKGEEETLGSSPKVEDRDLGKELARAAYGQTWIAKAPVNIIFTGNYEIIAQKYGREKAPRYTYMEVEKWGRF